MNAGTLAIQRVNCTYLAPTDHPAPENLRWRIDDVVRKNLPPLFENALAQTFDSGDESIWLIRKLEVDLAVDVGMLDDHALARAWTQQLATRLARIVSAGADGDGILHFPNRAAYLAQFARDLSRGSAWSKWYYTEFDTLRPLPDGTALVEAMLRDPSQGERACVTLWHSGDFERMLSTLTGYQAARLFEQFAASPAQYSAHEAATLALSAWDAAHLSHPARTPHNALRLLVSMLGQAPALLPDQAWSEAINSLLDLAAVLGRDTRLLPHLLRWVHPHAGSVSQPNDFAPGTLDWLTRATAGDIPWLLQIMQVVAPRAAANAQGTPTPSRASTLVTRFGGLVHLLGIWVELDIPQTLDQACAGLPADDRERVARALRLSLAMHCLGPESATALCADEGALLLLGVPAPFTPAELQQSLSHLEPSAFAEVIADDARPIEQEWPFLSLSGTDVDPGEPLDRALNLLAHNTLRRLARHLRGFEGSSAAYLRANILDSTATLSLDTEALHGEALAEALTVQLTQPPLGMLLRMAGLDEYHFELPWWPGREVRVVMELPL